MNDHQPNENKTDRRVIRTRQALRQALMELVKEKNYEAISVEEIAARANLGRATFYLHYHDKEDLLLDEFNEMANDRVRALAEMPISVWAPDSNPFEPGRWSSLPLLKIFEQAAENAMLYRILLGGAGSRRLANGVREITTKAIQNFLESRLSRESIPLQIHAPIGLLGAYFTGALFSTIAWWLDQNPQPEPEAMARMFQRLFFTGAIAVFGANPPMATHSPATP